MKSFIGAMIGAMVGVVIMLSLTNEPAKEKPQPLTTAEVIKMECVRIRTEAPVNLSTQSVLQECVRMGY